MAQPKYVDWDGLVYYDGKIKEYVATRDAQGIKMGGVIPFAELPDPSFTNLNYIYKITDGFTSNRDFEKPNLIYKENTWVQCANINNTDTYLYIIFNDNELEGQGGKFDPENYYTKEEIDTTFVTKSDVASEFDDISEDIETANQSILDLASHISTNADDIETLKQDLAETEVKVDDVEAAVKSIKVPTKVSDLENDAKYITEKDIPEVNLDDVYTKEEVDNLTADLVSKKELADDVSDLEAKINEIEVPTKVSELENDAGYITSEDLPDVTDLVTKEEFEVVQQQSAGNNVKIFQLDEEIVDIKQQLENIPEAELYKVDFNKPDFAAAKAAYEAGKVLILINAAPDVNSYALMNYVSDTFITFTKFLTSRKQTYGAFNTYYLTPNDSWEISKEVRLNKVEANAEGKIEGSLRTIQIGNEIYTLPDLTGYATEDFVIAKISEAELSGDGSDIDLSVYALKSDVPSKVSQLENDKGYITSIPDEYITETELNARNFATNADLSSKADVSALDAYAKVEDIAEKADRSELVDLATKEFVTEAISNIEIPETDLSDYYTKAETDDAIKVAVDGIDIPEVDLDPYATTEYVDAKVAEVDAITEKQRYEVRRVPGLEVTYRDDEIRINTEHITLEKQNVGEGGDPNGYHINIKIYAPDNATHVKQIITSAPGNFGDKAAVPFTESDVDRYGRKYSNAEVKCAVYNTASGTWLNYGLNSTADKCLGYYYSVEWYDADGNVIESDNIHVVFTNDACHYTSISDAITRRIVAVETELDSIVIPQIPTNVSAFSNDAGYITEIPSEYVTESELDGKGFITDISGKADVEHKHTLSDITDYVAPDLDDYATKEFVSSEIAKAQLSGGDVDLSDYYTRGEVDKLIPDTSKFIEMSEVEAKGYTTMAAVEAKGYLTEHQDLSDYATKAELPDVTGFIKMTDVEAKGYITLDEVPADDTKLDKATYDADKLTFATKSDIPTDYLTDSDLEGYAKVTDIPTDHITMSDVEAKGYITAADIANKADKSELTDFVTEEWVDEQGYLTEHQDLTDYAKKSDIPTDYLTDEDIVNKADKSELTSLATKDEVLAVENKIPSVDGLATITYVDEQIGSIDVPDVSNFVTADFVTELVNAKADDILFADDRIVGNAVGSFVVGEPVKGLTIRQLFEKLLGLTVPVTPDEPSDPDEDLSLIERIIKNELSMYSITDDGQLVKSTFKTLSMDAEPTESGFVVEYDTDGKAITGGYQELSINNDEMYYVIALPKEIDYNTQISVQAYDPDEKLWNDAELYLTSDPDIVAACCDEIGIDTSHIDTSNYTIWTSEDICTGSILRFIIKE